MFLRIFSLLLLVVAVDNARAQQPVSPLQERAAAERRLAAYGDTNLRDLQLLANAFQEKYNFIKDVELLSLPVDRLCSKITTEFKAGAYNEAVVKRPTGRCMGGGIA